MKKHKYIMYSMLLVFMIGCTSSPVNKNVSILDLDSSKYKVSVSPALDAPYDTAPYSVDLNGVTKQTILGSILDTSANTLTFETKWLFAYENQSFQTFVFSKENRIIDYTIQNDELYYLTYYIGDNTVCSQLFKYIDGQNDLLLKQFGNDGFYNPPRILEYEGGFAIVNENSNKMEIYQYANATINTLYEEKFNEGNTVPSLSQVHGDTLYILVAYESGNTIIEINLENGKTKEHKTMLKFAGYAILDDYIVIFDENQKKEIVYNKDMKELWSSDVPVNIVRWVKYASGNTLVYSDNASNDMFIRNYNDDVLYRISAQKEAVLKETPVNFLTSNNVIYTTSMEKNLIYAIEFSEEISK